MNLRKQAIYTSYLIGFPIGIFLILIVLYIPVIFTGEGLSTIVLVGAYGKEIFGLIFAFLIALGIGGRNASVDIQKHKTLLKTSFKYSLTVNAIIWSVFIAITILDNLNTSNGILILILIPIIAFIFSTIITTFTLGLLICYIIKNKSTLISEKHKIENNNL